MKAKYADYVHSKREVEEVQGANQLTNLLDDSGIDFQKTIKTAIEGINIFPTSAQEYNRLRNRLREVNREHYTLHLPQEKKVYAEMTISQRTAPLPLGGRASNVASVARKEEEENQHILAYVGN